MAAPSLAGARQPAAERPAGRISCGLPERRTTGHVRSSISRWPPGTPAGMPATTRARRHQRGCTSSTSSAVRDMRSGARLLLVTEDVQRDLDDGGPGLGHRSVVLICPWRRSHVAGGTRLWTLAIRTSSWCDRSKTPIRPGRGKALRMRRRKGAVEIVHSRCLERRVPITLGVHRTDDMAHHAALARGVHPLHQRKKCRCSAALGVGIQALLQGHRAREPL